MKHLLLLSLAAITLMGCSKKTTTVAAGSGSYKGVVIKNTCCLIAIHSLGANALGPAWTDSGSAPISSYDHAFRVANACQFGDYTPGDTISFNIAAAQTRNCVCCMLYTTMPDTVYSIQVVK